MDTETAVAVAMYKNGDTVAAITEATGLTLQQLGAAVTASGIPFVADRRPATEQPPVRAVQAVPDQPHATTAEDLITWGMQHTSARMQRLADQARGALADLQQAQRREAVVSAAEDRLRQAREQLAAAEQALRAAKGTTSSTTEAAAGTGDGLTRDERAAIRAWARKTGHQVGTAGRISREVIDAYRAAHPAPLAAAS